MEIFGEEISPQAVSLARYAKKVGYTEWAFFGISHPDNKKFNLRKIWTQSLREQMLSYLSIAQQMIEDIVEYPIKPRWIDQERKSFSPHFHTKWCHAIELGIEAREILVEDAVIDLASSFAVSTEIGTITLSGIDPSLKLNEIRITFPDSLELIEHSKAYFDSIGDLIIEIPKARLVVLSERENPEEGLLYDDPSIFQILVDVHRVYNDSSEQIGLRYVESCSSFCSTVSEFVCGRIDDSELGAVTVDLTGIGCNCRNYDHMIANYRAGIEPTRMIEDVVIRLAHSLMAIEPCSEPIVMTLWNRDRSIPKILTRERIECPFGMSDGAWSAWKFAQSLQVVRSSSMIFKSRFS